jgi:hypothetical protein
MKSFKLATFTTVAAALAFPTLTHAQNSPWLPAPGSGSVSLNYFSQDADKFYIGGSLMSLPFGRIKINTTTLAAQYGVSDAFAVDAKIPFARRTSGLGSDNGTGDSRVGVTWRFLDEFEQRGLPSVAIRAGAIIAGNYQTQRPDSIGDGASGVEVSLLVGRYLTSNFGIRGEVGIRDRNRGVPNQTFVSVGADLRITPSLGASVGFSSARNSGNLDIGGAGFTPARFQQVAERRNVINAGLSYAVTERVSINGNLGKVTSGRNTSKNDLYSLGVAFDF